ncbi:MAG: hypothetical protein ACLRFI_03740 [Alphaproteobacteria bacterium]
MKKYYGTTTPIQIAPGGNWEMYAFYQDDKNGCIGYKKKTAKTLNEINRIKTQLLAPVQTKLK